MFNLLHRTVLIAVNGAAHSFQYAAPFMTAVAAVAAVYWRGDLLPPFGAAILALVVLAAFGIPYIGAVLHTMLRGETPPFVQVLRWRLRDLDFLLFMAAAFLFGGLLIVLIADIGMNLYDYAALQEDNPTRGEKYGYGEGAALVLLFGSRTFAAVFFIAAILLWSYFSRSAMRIAAYMDGYDLSSDEAMVLTRHYKLQIMAVSLLVNTGLSIAVVSTPWGLWEWWLQAIMAGVAAWVFLHINLALSVAMYEKYAAGYQMRLLRH